MGLALGPARRSSARSLWFVLTTEYRESDGTVGIARIMRIDEEPSTRVLQRCPECQGSGIKKRLTKKPLYRCKNEHEFEQAVRENASCTKYTAHFAGAFKPFTEVFGRDFPTKCPQR